ncbi:cytidine deaminase [Halotalea alkalilenta]|uniref:Cytidine deaminase n=1 Tax=Halotalea alkalilenta TaxID=376489 RepID=A0A172YF09_9GAMM|nr:cytidine deaminase [Halotalea alkalilenta]ANF57696.1 cytidine deaminase [Halotalea alkalilenta]
MLDDDQVQALVTQAIEARRQAYMPYSSFAVGAAILSEDGEVFLGCNIENASYGLTNCAERTAVFKAVSSGQRRFKAIAVVADTLEPVSPCGACRQVLAEFCDEHTRILLANLGGQVCECSIDELLPGAFRARDMHED